AGVALVAGPVVDPAGLEVAVAERVVVAADAGEAGDVLEGGAIGTVAAAPERLAVRRVVAALEVLLGAVVEARDAVFREQVDERRVRRARRCPSPASSRPTACSC
ncbi:MAG: hypothetical protein AB8H79_10550, partial [Myxococcota bacterium]